MREPSRSREPEPDPSRSPRSSTNPRFYRDETPTFEEPVTIRARARMGRRTADYEEQDDSEPDTAEMEPVGSRPRARAASSLDGVTESADWGWDDPEDFSGTRR